VAARVARARERLDAVALEDRTLLLIAGICARLGVDGLRADIVCARAARALAALDGAGAVGEDHVRRAALLALAHRRRRGPLEAPGLAPGELEEALEAARGDEGPEPGGGGPPGGGHAWPEPDAGAPEPAGAGAPGAPRGEAAPPDPAGARTPAAAAPRGEDARATDPRGVARERRDAPGAPAPAPDLRLAGTGRGAAGRRSRAAARHGQPVDSRPPAAAVSDLAVAATLRAVARRRAAGDGAALLPADLREHVRAGREGNLVVFCVDASGSMGARRRMAAVKGAVLGLLLDAYRRRDRVALVTFRGTGTEVVLPPTGSVERAAAALEGLATGGGTPLAAGLARAAALVAAERRRDPERRALVLVVTDGRASGGRAGREAACDAATALARAADGLVVFDGEEGPVRLGLAGAIARAAGAPLLPLARLHPIPERPRRAA
jgi:magnesium chelatase subunit D